MDEITVKICAEARGIWSLDDGDSSVHFHITMTEEEFTKFRKVMKEFEEWQTFVKKRIYG